MRTFFELLTTQKDNKEKVVKEDFVSYQLIFILKKDKFINVLKKDEYFEQLVLSAEEALRILNYYEEKKINTFEAEKDVYSVLERMDDFLYEIFE